MPNAVKYERGMPVAVRDQSERAREKRQIQVRETVGYGVALKPHSNPAFSSKLIRSQKGVCLVTSGN